MSIQVDESSSPRLSPPLLQMCYMHHAHILYIHTHTPSPFFLQADIMLVALLQSTLHHHLKQSLCILHRDDDIIA